MTSPRQPESAGKSPRHLLRQSLLLMLLLLAVFTGVILAAEGWVFREELKSDREMSTQGIRKTLDTFENDAREIGSWFYRDLNATVQVMSLSLQDQVQEGEYRGQRLFEDGFVARVTDSGVDIPGEMADRFPALTAEMVRQEYTQHELADQGANEGNPQANTQANESNPQANNPPASGSDPQDGAIPEDGDWTDRADLGADGNHPLVLVTSGKIAGEWYYVDWTPYEEYLEYLQAQLDLDLLIDTIGRAYEGELFLVSTPRPDLGFVHATPGLAGYGSLADLGLTPEDLKKESIEIRRPEAMRLFPVPLEPINLTAVYCEPTEALAAQGIDRMVTMLLLVMLLLVVLVTWVVSLRKLAGARKLTEEQKIRYAPTRVRKVALRAGILATVLVTGAAFFIRSLQTMHHLSEDADGVFLGLEVQLEAEAARDENTRQQEIEWYIYFGNRIAEQLSATPSLAEREKLAEIARVIEADFIIVFDEEGRQTACSRDYIDFVLPEDPEVSTSDFRRILKGIPYVVHGTEYNAVTGETHQMIGVRYPIRKDRFGVLLIAVNENVIMQSRLTDNRARIYPKLTDGKVTILEIQDGQVVSSSRKDLEGRSTRSLGIPDSAPRMNFFRMDGDPCYGISREIAGSVFCLVQDEAGIFRTGMAYAGIAGAAFAVLWGVMAWFLLRGYNHSSFLSGQASARQGAPAGTKLAVEWGKLMPEQKAHRMFQILLGVLVVYLMISASGHGALSENAVLSFVFAGEWTRGFNLFSITACLAVVCLAVFAWLIGKAVFMIAVRMTRAKGETICRLADNLFEYVIVMAAAYYIFSYLGVDTNTLLASVGLLSLAVSLGARDLMADILAGIGIVFEGDYGVGDIVSINNFRGTIAEIGVRSMKIRSEDNNILIVNNHEIHNVINMSRYTSTLTADFDIPLNIQAADLEALMARELPRVGEAIPEIIGTPSFRGITAIKKGTMTITIAAECAEKDLGRARRKMNRALKAVFEQEGIPIG